MFPNISRYIGYHRCIILHVQVLKLLPPTLVVNHADQSYIVPVYTSNKACYHEWRQSGLESQGPFTIFGRM